VVDVQWRLSTAVASKYQGSLSSSMYSVALKTRVSLLIHLCVACILIYNRVTLLAAMVLLRLLPVLEMGCAEQCKMPWFSPDGFSTVLKC
jgi:hypothetical protein